MRSLKALGPDGFQPLFFNKTWEKTGPALTDFVPGVLRRDEILGGGDWGSTCTHPQGRKTSDDKEL